LPEVRDHLGEVNVQFRHTFFGFDGFKKVLPERVQLEESSNSSSVRIVQFA
jgi:hypothetical protein